MSDLQNKIARNVKIHRERARDFHIREEGWEPTESDFGFLIRFADGEREAYYGDTGEGFVALGGLDEETRAALAEYHALRRQVGEVQAALTDLQAGLVRGFAGRGWSVRQIGAAIALGKSRVAQLLAALGGK